MEWNSSDGWMWKMKRIERRLRHRRRRRDRMLLLFVGSRLRWGIVCRWNGAESYLIGGSSSPPSFLLLLLLLQQQQRVVFFQMINSRECRPSESCWDFGAHERTAGWVHAWWYATTLSFFFFFFFGWFLIFLFCSLFFFFFLFCLAVGDTFFT